MRSNSKSVQNARRELEQQGLRVNAIDGARVEFDDGWGLVRASNTQPVLVYRFEASSQKRLLEEIRQLDRNGGLAADCEDVGHPFGQGNNHQRRPRA